MTFNLYGLRLIFTMSYDFKNFKYSEEKPEVDFNLPDGSEFNSPEVIEHFNDVVDKYQDEAVSDIVLDSSSDDSENGPFSENITYNEFYSIDNNYHYDNHVADNEQVYDNNSSYNFADSVLSNSESSSSRIDIYVSDVSVSSISDNSETSSTSKPLGIFILITLLLIILSRRRRK